MPRSPEAPRLGRSCPRRDRPRRRPAPAPRRGRASRCPSHRSRTCPSPGLTPAPDGAAPRGPRRGMGDRPVRAPGQRGERGSTRADEMRAATRRSPPTSSRSRTSWPSSSARPTSSSRRARTGSGQPREPVHPRRRRPGARGRRARLRRDPARARTGRPKPARRRGSTCCSASRSTRRSDDRPAVRAPAPNRLAPRSLDASDASAPVMRSHGRDRHGPATRDPGTRGGSRCAHDHDPDRGLGVRRRRPRGRRCCCSSPSCSTTSWAGCWTRYSGSPSAATTLTPILLGFIACSAPAGCSHPGPRPPRRRRRRSSAWWPGSAARRSPAPCSACSTGARAGEPFTIADLVGDEVYVSVADPRRPLRDGLVQEGGHDPRVRARPPTRTSRRAAVRVVGTAGTGLDRCRTSARPTAAPTRRRARRR